MEVGSGPPPTVAEKQEQDKLRQQKLKQEAYDFDPNAPPEEKAAQIKKVRTTVLALARALPTLHSVALYLSVSSTC